MIVGVSTISVVGLDGNAQRSGLLRHPEWSALFPGTHLTDAGPSANRFLG